MCAKTCIEGSNPSVSANESGPLQCRGLFLGEVPPGAGHRPAGAFSVCPPRRRMAHFWSPCSVARIRGTTFPDRRQASTRQGAEAPLISLAVGWTAVPPSRPFNGSARKTTTFRRDMGPVNGCSRTLRARTRDPDRSLTSTDTGRSREGTRRDDPQARGAGAVGPEQRCPGTGGGRSTGAL